MIRKIIFKNRPNYLFNVNFKIEPFNLEKEYIEWSFNVNYILTSNRVKGFNDDDLKQIEILFS